MLADSDCERTYRAWKALSAFRGKRVKKPQRFSERIESVSGYRPIRNIIMYLFGIHVVNVLWVIAIVKIVGCAVKLPGLKDDVAEVLLSDARIFAIRHIDAVHNNACNSLHTCISFAACLTLYKPCEKLSVGKRHKHRSFTKTAYAKRRGDLTNGKYKKSAVVKTTALFALKLLADLFGSVLDTENDVVEVCLCETRMMRGVELATVEEFFCVRADVLSISEFFKR